MSFENSPWPSLLLYLRIPTARPCYQAAAAGRASCHRLVTWSRGGIHVGRGRAFSSRCAQLMRSGHSRHFSNDQQSAARARPRDSSDMLGDTWHVAAERIARDEGHSVGMSGSHLDTPCTSDASFPPPLLQQDTRCVVAVRTGGATSS